jgi:hypothetical protein
LNDQTEITVLDSELITGGDSETSYTLRKITPEKQRELVDKHTRRGNNRRQETIDVDRLQEDQLDYALTAWKGVLDRGKPADCSRENKIGGLDLERRVAIITRASITDVVAAQEARAESFR